MFGSRVSAGCMSSVGKFPLVRKPSGEFRNGYCGQAYEQLREVELRVHVVAPAGTCQAGKDCCRSTTARVADEKRVLAIEDNTFHL